MTLAVLACGALSAAPARALPKFAQKENKPCAYCHVNPKGSGKRTAAGQWYKAHGLSFRGYAPARPAPKNNKNNNKVKKSR